MIEIEAAEEKLVRLSRARMLRDDHARHRLHDFPRSQQRPARELLRADHAFIRRAGDADETVRPPGDDNLLQPHRLVMRGRRSADGTERGKERDHAQSWIFHAWVSLVYKARKRNKNLTPCS